VVVWCLSKKNADAAIETLEVRKESFEKQLIKIKESHKKELSDRDKLLKEYYETIDAIEKKYEEKNVKLTKSEKVSIKNMIEQSKEDPDVVKEKIKNLFNIPDIN
tara:strand:+ start:63 stop:377 length:315 start_codon:yes stop_codon:yes gene_type:complete